MPPRRDYTSLDDAIANGEGVERPFVCHMHPDTNASASVNVEKGVWYCFACHASGRADRKGTTFTAEMKRTIEAFEDVADAPKHDQRWLDIFDAYGTHPYWERRFGAEVSRRYRLGIHPVTGNPCYPLIGADGLVHGVVQRTGGTPKYLYPAGVGVSRMLYGFSKRRVRTVVVVEGACDAIAVSEALGSMSNGASKTTMVVGSYGAGLHLPQVELINSIGPSKVLLGFDDDDAGKRAKARQYPLHAEVRNIAWGKKDPGECTVEEIVRAVRRRSTAARKGTA